MSSRFLSYRYHFVSRLLRSYPLRCHAAVRPCACLCRFHAVLFPAAPYRFVSVRIRFPASPFDSVSSRVKAAFLAALPCPFAALPVGSASSRIVSGVVSAVSAHFLSFRCESVSSRIRSNGFVAVRSVALSNRCLALLCFSTSNHILTFHFCDQPYLFLSFRCESLAVPFAHRISVST